MGFGLRRSSSALAAMLGMLGMLPAVKRRERAEEPAEIAPAAPPATVVLTDSMVLPEGWRVQSFQDGCEDAKKIAGTARPPITIIDEVEDNYLARRKVAAAMGRDWREVVEDHVRAERLQAERARETRRLEVSEPGPDTARRRRRLRHRV